MNKTKRLDHGGMNGVSGQVIAAYYAWPPSVIQGWLNSSGHRAILLGRDYHHVGFGKQGPYWVADFKR